MGTMPKEYWATYERKSPHVSGKNLWPRLRISCDWTLIDNAAQALEFASGSALVAEMARLASEAPWKFQMLVSRIETGNFARGEMRVRNVRCSEWELAGVADAVRAALFRISYGNSDTPQ